MNPTITLHWERVGTFRDLLSSDALLKKYCRWDPGVYLHTSKFDGLKCIAYIGRTSRSLALRQFEHYFNTISGANGILDEKGRWTGLDVERPRLYKKRFNGERNSEFLPVILDIDKYIDRVKRCWEYAHKVELFLADVPKQEGEISYKDVEAQLINNFKPLENSTAGHNKGIEIIHEGDLKTKKLEEYKENNEELRRRWKLL